jgi:hypothetical protein
MYEDHEGLGIVFSPRGYVLTAKSRLWKITFSLNHNKMHLYGTEYLKFLVWKHLFVYVLFRKNIFVTVYGHIYVFI